MDLTTHFGHTAERQWPPPGTPQLRFETIVGYETQGFLLLPPKHNASRETKMAETKRLPGRLGPSSSISARQTRILQHLFISICNDSQSMLWEFPYALPFEKFHVGISGG